MLCQKTEIGYDNGQEHPIKIDTSVISYDEDDSPTPKHSKRSFLSRLTGLPIFCQQAEEETKKNTHHPTTTDFNLDGPTNSTKPVVIDKEEYKQTTTASYELIQ